MYKASSSTEIRKERGRKRKTERADATGIAGEKRKQKLALLDELLRNDSRDSASSISDEADEHFGPAGLPIRGRRVSSSPAPSSLPHTPLPPQWAAVAVTTAGQDMASVGVPGYGVETYVDNWMSYFDRGSNGSSVLFEGGQQQQQQNHQPPHDFARNFVSPDAESFSLNSSSSQFYSAPAPAATATTTAATSATIPLDPSLAEAQASQYSHPGAALGGYPPELLGYEGAEIRSYVADMDPKMMATLENFESLSARQQQEFLSLIRKRRTRSEPSGMEGDSLEMRYLGDYQVVPPPPGNVEPPFSPKE